MNKMKFKLLVLTAHYPPEAGAASIRVSEIVKKFSADENISNLKVLIFNPEEKEFSANNWIKISEKVEILRLKPLLPSIFHKFPIINPLTLLEWVIAILKIKDYHPDFIISSTPPSHPAILAYVHSKLFKSKYLVDIRDDGYASVDGFLDSQPFFIRYLLKLSNLFFNFIYILACKNATLNSCVLEALKTKFAKLQKTSIIVVPNGINSQELSTIKSGFDRESVFRKHNIKFNEFTKILVFVGDLKASYYNPEIILDTQKNLISKGFCFKYIIIGDGNKKEKIAKLAEEKGIKEYVYLLGKKNHSEALELMLAGDIAIYSLIENEPQAKYAFSLKLYEYIACELPILAVADDDSAASMLVMKNKMGVSLNWDDVKGNENLKNALLNIIENHTLYSQNVSEYYRNNLSKFDRSTGLNVLHTEIFKILK